MSDKEKGKNTESPFKKQKSNNEQQTSAPPPAPALSRSNSMGSIASQQTPNTRGQNMAAIAGPDTPGPDTPASAPTPNSDVSPITRNTGFTSQQSRALTGSLQNMTDEDRAMALEQQNINTTSNVFVSFSGIINPNNTNITPRSYRRAYDNFVATLGNPSDALLNSNAEQNLNSRFEAEDNSTPPPSTLLARLDGLPEQAPAQAPSSSLMNQPDKANYDIDLLTMGERKSLNQANYQEIYNQWVNDSSNLDRFQMMDSNDDPIDNTLMNMNNVVINYFDNKSDEEKEEIIECQLDYLIDSNIDGNHLDNDGVFGYTEEKDGSEDLWQSTLLDLINMDCHDYANNLYAGIIKNENDINRFISDNDITFSEQSEQEDNLLIDNYYNDNIVQTENQNDKDEDKNEMVVYAAEKVSKELLVRISKRISENAHIDREDLDALSTNQKLKNECEKIVDKSIKTLSNNSRRKKSELIVGTAINTSSPSSATVSSKSKAFTGPAATALSLIGNTTKITKAQRQQKYGEAVYDTATTVISKIICGEDFDIEKLSEPNRNSILKSIFWVLMGGKKEFKNFRESTAMGVSNYEQMTRVWGRETTQHYQKGENGYCYLCGGKIENDHYPEMEHKICCSQFYTQIYNIVLYNDLLIIWQTYLNDNVNNNNNGVNDKLIQLYTYVNYTFDKDNFEELYNKDIFKNFTTYPKIQSFLNGGDPSRREFEFNDFKLLLKINLAEFSWSHHLCNQLKTDHYLPSSGQEFYEHMNSVKTCNKVPEDKPELKSLGLKGAVISTSQTIKEFDTIKKALLDTDRKEIVSDQIEYIQSLIGQYATKNGVTRKRLFCRTIRRMHMDILTGKRAAIAALKKIAKTAKKTSDTFIEKVTSFVKDNKEGTLLNLFESYIPASSRVLNGENFEVPEKLPQPFMLELKEILNLLYFSFKNTSIVEGLRLLNHLFKSIHSEFIRDNVTNCNKPPTTIVKLTNYIRARVDYKCARYKFALNLLHVIRNALLNDETIVVTYDRFDEEKIRNLNDYYNEIEVIINNNTDHKNYKLNDNDQLIVDGTIDDILDLKQNIKTAYSQLYTEYKNSMTDQTKGIPDNVKSINENSSEEDKFINTSLKPGPESLLHMLAFTHNLKNYKNGKVNSRGGAKNKTRNRRRSKKKTRRKRKDKRKTKKRKTYKRKNRRTKYKR